MKSAKDADTVLVGKGFRNGEQGTHVNLRHFANKRNIVGVAGQGIFSANREGEIKPDAPALLDLRLYVPVLLNLA